MGDFIYSRKDNGTITPLGRLTEAEISYGPDIVPSITGTIACTNDFNISKFVHNELSSMLFSSSPFIPYIDKKYIPERIDINKEKCVVHVKWKDGEHTKIKLMPGDTFDEYTAFCICLAKRIYGSNSKLKNTIDNNLHYPDEKKKNLVLEK